MGRGTTVAGEAAAGAFWRVQVATLQAHLDQLHASLFGLRSGLQALEDLESPVNTHANAQLERLAREHQRDLEAVTGALEETRALLPCVLQDTIALEHQRGMRTCDNAAAKQSALRQLEHSGAPPSP